LQLFGVILIDCFDDDPIGGGTDDFGVGAFIGVDVSSGEGDKFYEHFFDFFLMDACDNQSPFAVLVLYADVVFLFGACWYFD
jgi:hypothetical protein